MRYGKLLKEERYRCAVYKILISKEATSFGDGDHKFKFFWQRNSEGTNGVAIAIVDRLTENLPEVSRVNEHVMRLNFVFGHTVCNIVYAYAPQAARGYSKKMRFV